MFTEILKLFFLLLFETLKLMMSRKNETDNTFTARETRSRGQIEEKGNRSVQIQVQN